MLAYTVDSHQPKEGEMSDERLRALERRWGKSGSVEDEAAYLRELIRAGDLEKQRLELAAYLQHEAARMVLGNEAPSPPDEFREWAKGFAPYGKECLVRVALSAAQSCIHLWAKEYPNNCLPQQAIMVVAKWINDPSYRNRNAALNPSVETEHAAQAASNTAFDAAVGDDIDDTAARAAWSASGAASAVFLDYPDAIQGTTDAVQGTTDAVFSAAMAIISASQIDRCSAAWESAFVDAQAQIRASIFSDIIPWALGYGDPIREFLKEQNTKPGTD